MLTSSRKGANWDSIFRRTKKYGLKGDLTQQFAVLKEWLENDRKKMMKHSKRPYRRKLPSTSRCANLLETLSAERLIRCEKQRDVPDRDGSKPFVFSIDGKDLQASNHKGADWKRILSMTKTYVSKGNLTQQVAVLKEWLESDWRLEKRAYLSTASTIAAADRVTVYSKPSQDRSPVKKLRTNASPNR